MKANRAILSDDHTVAIIQRLFNGNKFDEDAAEMTTLFEPYCNRAFGGLRLYERCPVTLLITYDDGCAPQAILDRWFSRSTKVQLGLILPRDNYTEGGKGYFRETWIVKWVIYFPWNVICPPTVKRESAVYFFVKREMGNLFPVKRDLSASRETWFLTLFIPEMRMEFWFSVIPHLSPYLQRPKVLWSPTFRQLSP